MDRIQITGGIPLKGKIRIGGAKNAALPLMAACLLTEEEVVFSNIPNLSDITTMANLLVALGVDLSVGGDGNDASRTLALQASDITDTVAPYDIVRKMRASVVVLGPLLARFGKARVSLPGGCAIGTRPIDFHLDALEQMGAKITLKEGYIDAQIKGRLKGTKIKFPHISVGATENILMAATLAEGKTIIKNAAQEPEVTDLANFLVKMGADIKGIGTGALTINGVDKLKGAEHSVLPDRIEAGTFAVAAAITGGELELVGAEPDIMQATIDILKKAGAKIEKTEKGIRVSRKGKIKSTDISTAPYPGFATDMQAQFTALMCVADGKSEIKENIFENRFMHVPELHRMGADIEQEENTITVTGVEKLLGAEVMATDLRASVCLVLAALVAEGSTMINRVYHIDRGYERIEEKLAMCGADIIRLKGSV